MNIEIEKKWKETQVYRYLQVAGFTKEVDTFISTHYTANIDIDIEKAVERKTKKLKAIVRQMDKDMRGDQDILLYDIYAMAFYYDTDIWPPGKSAPMQMYHDLTDEERHEKWQEWINL